MAVSNELVFGEHPHHLVKNHIHYYRLEKSGKFFDLFGSNHSVSLSSFAKSDLENVEKNLREGQFFVCEGFRQPLTQAFLEKNGYLRNPNDKTPYWINELTLQEQNAVNSVLDAIKLRYHLTFNNQDVLIGAIPLFIIDNIFDNGMDADIQHRYRQGNNFYSLNDDAEDEPIPLAENTGTVHTVAELKPIIESHFFNSEYKTLLLNNHKQYLSGEPVWLEEEDIKEITLQNKAWHHQIRQLRASRKETNMVVVVGAAHLYGGYGLLSLFEKAGYSLSRMNSEGKFIPLQQQQLFYMYGSTRTKEVVNEKFHTASASKSFESTFN